MLVNGIRGTNSSFETHQGESRIGTILNFAFTNVKPALKPHPAQESSLQSRSVFEAETGAKEIWPSPNEKSIYLLAL
jgi:hypothetical protein